MRVNGLMGLHLMLMSSLEGCGLSNLSRLASIEQSRRSCSHAIIRSRRVLDPSQAAALSSANRVLLSLLRLETSPPIRSLRLRPSR